MHPTILQDLRDTLPSEFVAKYLFDRTPHVFADRDRFVAWKGALSKALEVDAASITLVGSAAIGLSLNPEKNFAAFSSRSDIDVAIISHFHFSAAWRFLRGNGHVRMSLSQRQRIAWKEHVDRLIFWGTIATDKLLPVMPFAKEWMSAAARAAEVDEIASREIKFRIYSDYESLRAYQVNSIKRAQLALIERKGLV